MVDFQDPTVIAQDYLALVKLFHTVAGLYIWEFLTTLDYEWSVIKGHRPYRWTIWIYSLTRVSTVMAVIHTLVNLDTTKPINCQVWIKFTFVFYLPLASAMLLITLRTVAIWNRNKVVTVLALGGWLVYLACFIQVTFRLHSEWSSRSNACTPPTTERIKVPLTIMAVMDIALVLAMFLGLLRLRDRGGGIFGLARLLWKQGVIWLFFCTGTGITVVVFVWLDLNAVFNIIFTMPGVISFSITATRIYRSLTDFISSTDIVDSELERSGRTASSRNAGQMLMPVVHVTSEQYPTSQGIPLAFNTNEQQCYKAQGLSLDDSLESGVGK